MKSQLASWSLWLVSEIYPCPTVACFFHNDTAQNHKCNQIAKNCQPSVESIQGITRREKQTDSNRKKDEKMNGVIAKDIGPCTSGGLHEF